MYKSEWENYETKHFAITDFFTQVLSNNVEISHISTEMTFVCIKSEL